MNHFSLLFTILFQIVIVTVRSSPVRLRSAQMFFITNSFIRFNRRKLPILQSRCWDVEICKQLEMTFLVLTFGHLKGKNLIVSFRRQRKSTQRLRASRPIATRIGIKRTLDNTKMLLTRNSKIPFFGIAELHIISLPRVSMSPFTILVNNLS